MAQYSSYDNTALRGLKLDTNTTERSHRDSSTDSDQKQSQRPHFHPSADSQDTITRVTATPPIEIPGHHDDFAIGETDSSLRSSESFVKQYLKDRQTVADTNDDVQVSTGHRRSVLEPARKSNHNDARGRSLAQALYYHRNARTHSESDSSHFDPHTGRHLPKYSESPPKDEAHFGEARFPLLQRTVDALARQRSRDLPQPLSMTSASTMSPVEEAVLTPTDSVTSSVALSPSILQQFSSSYEPPRPRSQRKASERWRDGEAAPDFFARAGSLKKGDRDTLRRPIRKDTQSSTKSPHSDASSFLRGFSVGAGSDDAAAPPPVDAEGATVGEDYVLGKQIGYGGFSIIREVKQISAQTGTQRTLAVKIVKKQIEGKSKTENDVAQADFEHEVDLWRLLNHRHLLSLEAVYELNEATFCFVPLNVGGTLFDLVNNSREGLSPQLAVSYSYQLASALRYLHLDAHVVHRDIKLENCLVEAATADQPGLLRVCDFGLAEWISTDNDSMTSASSDTDRDRPLRRYFGPADSSTSAFAGGSLEYAAPEVLRLATSASGDVHPDDLPPMQSLVSPAVDIWSMGVCMYALLMGRRPFQDAFQPRVVMAILAGDWNKHGLKDKAGNVAYKVVRSCLGMEAMKRPRIGEIYGHSWFEDVRSTAENSDAESESARASGWRL